MSKSWNKLSVTDGLVMAYSTASAKYPLESPIVTSDNYQVTLTVILKKIVHIIKANV